MLQSRRNYQLSTARLLTVEGGCSGGYVSSVCVCVCVQGCLPLGLGVSTSRSGACVLEYPLAQYTPGPRGRQPPLDRQTPVKTLLCPELRFWAVINSILHHTLITNIVLPIIARNVQPNSLLVCIRLIRPHFPVHKSVYINGIAGWFFMKVLFHKI